MCVGVWAYWSGVSDKTPIYKIDMNGYPHTHKSMHPYALRSVGVFVAYQFCCNNNNHTPSIHTPIHPQIGVGFVAYQFYNNSNRRHNGGGNRPRWGDGGGAGDGYGGNR